MVKHSTNQAPSAFLMRLGKEDTISFVRKNKFKTNLKQKIKKIFEDVAKAQSKSRRRLPASRPILSRRGRTAG